MVVLALPPVPVAGTNPVSVSRVGGGCGGGRGHTASCALGGGCGGGRGRTASCALGGGYGGARGRAATILLAGILFGELFASTEVVMCSSEPRDSIVLRCAYGLEGMEDGH